MSLFRLLAALILVSTLGAHDDPHFAAAQAAASDACRHAYGVSLIQAQVGTEWAKLGDTTRAQACFTAAQTATISIAHPLLQDYAWAHLANAAAAAGNDDLANQAFAAITDPRLRAHATWKLVNKLGKAKRIDEARALLDATRAVVEASELPPGDRAALLAETGGSYRFIDPALGLPLVEQALALAAQVDDPFDGAVLLNVIGACLVDVGAADRAAAVFAQAGERAETITDVSDRVHHLAMLGGERAEKNLRDDAVIALEAAVALALTLPSGEDREEVLSEIARNFGQAHRFTRALAVAEYITDPYYRAEGWIRIAKNQARMGHPADARALLERTTTLADGITDGHQQAIIRRKLASEWISLRERARAEPLLLQAAAGGAL